VHERIFYAPPWRGAAEEGPSARPPATDIVRRMTESSRAPAPCTRACAHSPALTEPACVLFGLLLSARSPCAADGGQGRGLGRQQGRARRRSAHAAPLHSAAGNEGGGGPTCTGMQPTTLSAHPFGRWHRRLAAILDPRAASSLDHPRLPHPWTASMCGMCTGPSQPSGADPLMPTESPTLPIQSGRGTCCLDAAPPSSCGARPGATCFLCMAVGWAEARCFQADSSPRAGP
jgi:hypothetical protein